MHVALCYVSDLGNPFKRFWTTLLLVPPRHSVVVKRWQQQSVDVNPLYSRWSDTVGHLNRHKGHMTRPTVQRLHSVVSTL